MAVPAMVWPAALDAEQQPVRGQTRRWQRVVGRSRLHHERRNGCRHGVPDQHRVAPALVARPQHVAPRSGSEGRRVAPQTIPRGRGLSRGPGGCAELLKPQPRRPRLPQHRGRGPGIPFGDEHRGHGVRGKCVHVTSSAAAIAQSIGSEPRRGDVARRDQDLNVRAEHSRSSDAAFCVVDDATDRAPSRCRLILGER